MTKVVDVTITSDCSKYKVVEIFAIIDSNNFASSLAAFISTYTKYVEMSLSNDLSSLARILNYFCKSYHNENL